MSYIYAASPYSHRRKEVRKRRYEEALSFVAAAANNHIVVYSPIVHFHNVAENYDMDTSFQFWMGNNYSMLERSRGMYILNIEGVHGSEGVIQERQAANLFGIPISNWYHNPKEREWTNENSEDLSY